MTDSVTVKHLLDRRKTPYDTVFAKVAVSFASEAFPVKIATFA